MSETLVNYPKTKRGEATLSKIVKAAEQVIGKKGYHNSSINDIAYKAKVAPGTIYIYFNDKYSLYCFLLEQYGRTIRRAISARVKKMTDHREKEREGILAFLEIIRERPYMYHIIWESMYIDKTLFVNYYETFAQRYIANLEKAREDGQVADDIDPMVMAYALMGISNFLGLKYVLFDTDADLPHVADEAIKLIERGIFSQR